MELSIREMRYQKIKKCIDLIKTNGLGWSVVVNAPDGGFDLLGLPINTSEGKTFESTLAYAQETITNDELSKAMMFNLMAMVYNNKYIEFTKTNYVEAVLLTWNLVHFFVKVSPDSVSVFEEDNVVYIDFNLQDVKGIK